MSELPEALSEQQAVRAVIQHYVEGARTGDGQRMQRAFHDNADIYGTLYKDGVSQLAGPIHILFDFVDATGAAEKLEVTSMRIDMAGDAASVRLELADWQGMRFTDFLNLVKTDQGWIIVNKVFHQWV